VILPGIGAFIADLSPARFDIETGRFFPPVREVCFNPVVNNNDGMLANSYARKYGITFAEASDSIAHTVESILSLLHEQGEVTIGRIGTLAQCDSLLTFSPSGQLHNLNENLGLLPVILKKNRSEQDVVKSIRKENEAISRDYEKNYYIPINKTFAKIAASFLFVVVLTLSVILPPINGDSRDKLEKASIIPQPEKIKNTFLKNKEEKISAPEISAERESREYKYYLIVATFHTLAEAEKYIAYRSDNLIVAPGEKIFRVSLAASDSKDELLMQLNSKDFAENYGEGWIWTNK